MKTAPKTPFCTPLSGSAREIQIRFKSILKWKKSRPPKIALVLALSIALLCCSMVACQKTNSEVPEEVQKLYVDYLETSKISVSEAVNQYCHYELPEHKEMALDSAACLDEYKNLKITKLSDRLWVTSAEMVDAYYPQGTVIYNYVGDIDGKYYVMTSDQQIPEELRSGIDFTGYTYDDKDIL